MSRTSTTRTFTLCISLFLLSALLTLTFNQPPRTRAWHFSRKNLPHQDRHITLNPAKVAFATFLAGNANPDAKPNDEESAAIHDEDDGYFQGARVLTYQLIRSPTTRTNNSIPLLVLCTRDVSKRKRDQLKREGATIVLVEKLTAEWAVAATPRWVDNLAKLRLFQLTEYSKICFIDADILVTAPLDGVFFDEATLTQATLPNPAQIHPENESPLPRTYMFASHSDSMGYEHAWPPPVAMLQNLTRAGITCNDDHMPSLTLANYL